MPLTPAPGNTMYGRTDFWIHGDSIEHPGLASLGCLCLPHAARVLIAASAATRLLVTTTP